MKRLAFLVIFLTALSTLSGYLLSKATWISRVGMSLFYNQYNFLKTWWKGALLVFSVLMILLIIQTIVQSKLPSIAAKIFHTIMLFAALVGLYFTYRDFRHTLSHRWLGERFHIGVYIFWLGWITISLFYIFQPKKRGKAVQSKFEIP